MKRGLFCVVILLLPAVVFSFTDIAGEYEAVAVYEDGELLSIDDVGVEMLLSIRIEQGVAYRMVIDLRAPGGTSGFTTDQIVLFSESDTYTLDKTRSRIASAAAWRRLPAHLVRNRGAYELETYPVRDHVKVSIIDGEDVLTVAYILRKR